MISNRVTLLGHKDHGKSTLIGSMLIVTKSVSSERLEKAKSISSKLGKIFEPGFIIDSFEEEHEGGLTIDTSRASLVFNGNFIEFIDVPGHEELIGNMITGASYGDTALIIISALRNEGITEQTKRHVLIAKMLDIKNLIVAVNKMDLISYDEKTFNKIKNEFKTYLDRIGWTWCTFVPISAYKMENLISRSGKIPWYEGECLITTILNAPKSKVSQSKKLSIILQGNLDNNTILGKILSGSIHINDKLLILPYMKNCKIENIFVKNKSSKIARKGINVAIRVNPPIGVTRGNVASTKNSNLHTVKAFDSLVFPIRNQRGDISININGTISKSLIAPKALIDKYGGLKDSKVLKSLSVSFATVRVQDVVVIERSIPELSRFTMYDSKGFLGIGVIK
jgi:sulfate adenylyltransferase subunit 1 (EFTu-like GTPase family)